eukprot:3398457-Pleurochrysis_carterae.AAC.1
MVTKRCRPRAKALSSRFTIRLRPAVTGGGDTAPGARCTQRTDAWRAEARHPDDRAFRADRNNGVGMRRHLEGGKAATRVEPSHGWEGRST